MKVFNINDSYFKYQKCLSGITYQFVNQLDNIYDKNLMVGTNYCIYCMYNEFDIINNFMINLYQVDVCSTNNLDITKRYYDIDGAYLKTGHRVLLVNQNDPIENDIYNVDSRGFLILSDELASTGKTWRYKAYVKLGYNKGKQFHLKNSGNRFPLKGERKYFLDGHGYIIKSIFNYDLFSTDSIIPKIIFTDYELARISVNKNYELYDGFEIPSITNGDTFDIQYHGGHYLINVDNDTSKFIYSGNTSGTTIYNKNNYPTDGFGYQTYIEVDTTFLVNANVNDYIKIEISGSTNLILKTFIKETGSTYIIISDSMPDNILNDLYTEILTYVSVYTVTNLMYSQSTKINDVVQESYYAKYFYINDLNNLNPKENPFNLYFDYDGFIFDINSSLYKFETKNHYINYRLYEHLYKINSYLFNSGYSFLDNCYLDKSTFRIEYFDEYPDYKYKDSKGTLIKVTPLTPSYVNYFKNQTYINIDTPTGKYKTLIIDLVPNEYFIIETYKSNTGLTNSADGLETIYNLKEISDILYDVYINDETPTNTDYYRIRDDNTRRNIFNGYAEFISQDLGIISNVTAFLMQDSDHKFILKVYDPENTSNGGYTRVPYVVTGIDESHTSASASLPGEVINNNGSSITSVGIRYGIDPSILNYSVTGNTTLIGPFTMYATNLSPMTPYYYQAFAKNEQGTGYGLVYSFKTSDPVFTPPVVVTKSITSTSHQIVITSEVIDIGFDAITQRGIVYTSGTSTPLLSDNPIIYYPESGTIGSYSIIVTGLSHDTLYSYNSFATNAICGTTLGNSGYTTTLHPSPPTLQTVGYQNLTYNSFDAIFNLVGNDGPTDDLIHGVDEMGIVWSNSNAIPTISDIRTPYNITSWPYTLGQQYTVNLTGLSFETNYYYRVYANNTLYSGVTTAYGPPVKWITTLSLPTAPIVNTSILSYFTYSAVTSNIVSDGGSPITSKGLYWKAGPTVTISDNYISATGTTNWQTIITGLTPTTLYSVMAQATNAFGTTLSNISGVTTMPIQTGATVILSYITSVSTGATLTGNVTNDGYANVTSKGILYSTSSTPTSPNLYGGSGLGSWTSNITGLTPSTVYYAVAYATNSITTSYSNTVTWTGSTGNSEPAFSASSPIVNGMGLTTASIKNDIISNGGDIVTASGVYYSGTTIPGLLHWYNGATIGTFYTTLTGLTAGGTYYVYAYATNSEGTALTHSTGFTTSIATIPSIMIKSTDTITYNSVNINSTVTSDGNDTVTSRGITGNTIGIWPYTTGGIGDFTIILTGLTQDTNYTGISYATNSIGTGSDITYFKTSAFNNVAIELDIISASSLDPYVYQVGTNTKDIATFVTITPNSVSISELWSGNTTSTFSSTTGLTWGNGILSTNNLSSPYSYAPIISGSENFVAIESCGTPSEIKSSTATIYAVYPFLTSNRVPETKPNGPIPSPSRLSGWASSGNFYNGNFPYGYESMSKKVEVKSNKVYAYTISDTNNLVYFAYPSTYGLLTSIVAGGTTIPMTGPGSPTIYLNIDMFSTGLINNWNVQYHVYAFMTSVNRGSNYYIEYYF